MAGNVFFSVSEFAKLSRTTRNTLHHYDAIGLLSPISRGEDNNYRYYSGEQLALINVVRILQASGMSLAEIKALKDLRTPELMDEIFARQREKIDEKIAEWGRAEKLLFTFQKLIRSVQGIDEGSMTIQFLPPEAIVLGDLNDVSRGRSDYDALMTFHRAIRKKFADLDLNYPVSAVFSEEQIKRGDYERPERFYLCSPEGRDRRPAALYAIGYARGWYGQTDELYERMVQFIDQNGFEICGDAYEEYPLNGICIVDPKNYLIRIMITVREKVDNDGKKGKKSE